jgi:hypothetical protein
MALSFDSGYGARRVNYAKKSFMKLTPGCGRNQGQVESLRSFYALGAVDII